MKIRNGFVSNSSTTSFCIYGIGLPKDIDRSSLKPPKDYSIERFQDCSDFNYAIGRDFCTIEDNETGKQFRDSVKKTIRELLNREIPDSDFDVQSDAYYDG